MRTGAGIMRALVVVLIFMASAFPAHSSALPEWAVPVQAEGRSSDERRTPRPLEPALPILSGKPASQGATPESGVPAIAVPVPAVARYDAQKDGRPISLAGVARPWREAAIAAEQAYLSIRQRKKPSSILPAAATCTVTTTADSGAGSLRQCLASATSGHTIVFNPSVFPPAAPANITLASALPRIITDSLTIDASNAGVILNGSPLTETVSGLIIDGASGVTIRGLQIVNFPLDGLALIGGASNNVIGGTAAEARNVIGGNGRVGIWIQDSGTTNNQVLGNYVGADASGWGAQGNGADGVLILLGASNNVIGGAASGAGNLIGGNADDGVQIEDPGTTDNRLEGNLIGVSVIGFLPLANGDNGVVILNGAQGNMVGGSASGAGNVISGNTYAGVQIQDQGTTDNKVQGNFIGTDTTGQFLPMGNEWGVLIFFGADNNTVGGTTNGARNVISGNNTTGVQFEGDGTTGNVALGNYVGTDATGMVALGNKWGVGIVDGAQNNVVGGTTAGARNVISGNEFGVQFEIASTMSNTVLGNYIGADVTGLAALGNLTGVVILGASNNTIGGEAAGARNLISGNYFVGVAMEEAGATSNKVLGNYIGTDATGAASLGTQQWGVVAASSATNNVIGGTTPAARNVMSGNTVAGISFQNPGTTGNLALGNYVGTDPMGMVAVGNEQAGILIAYGAQGNMVGGEANGARNLISGNSGAGIVIQSTGTTSNTVLGNFIGTNVTGSAPLSNTWGIVISFSAQNNIIGGTTPGARNVISGNGETGVQLQGDVQGVGTSGNSVLGNYIGTDPTGAAAVGNKVGVGVVVGAQNNMIGGVTPGARNVISGNANLGIGFQDDGTSGNQALGNYIGTDVSGTAPLGNLWGVGIFRGADGNLVGGTTNGAGNVISGSSGGTGVQIQDAGTTGNRVLGNYIGTNAAGTAALGNKWGVAVALGAQNNTVGSAAAGARNVISGNKYGIQFQDAGTTGNQVLGNYIGTDATGTFAIGNVLGVVIGVEADNNIVGGATSGAGNLISGNADSGVQIQDNGTSGNQVLGNSIGTNVTGTMPISNSWGVAIFVGADDNFIGGEATGAGNLISGNHFGVEINGNGTLRNRVQGNSIAENVEDGLVLGNGASLNTVGISNTIAGNGSSGVVMSGATTLRNTITRNAIYGNGGAPIDSPIPVPPFSICYVPVDADNVQATGTTCLNCRVEFFKNPTAVLAGTTFLEAVTANAGGNLPPTLLAIPEAARYASATVTDEQGTTSVFHDMSQCLAGDRLYLPLVLK